MADKSSVSAEAPIVASKSVVAPKYKARYRERATTAKLPKGTDRKVIARSCGDWLAVNLARLINHKRKMDRDAFAAILDANHVEHDKWSHLDNGRFRMTGGLALRHAIVEAGHLTLPDGEELTPPKAWIAAHTR
jgi:hypothetical protein